MRDILPWLLLLIIPLILTSCLDEVPVIPDRINPWDPENPYPPIPPLNFQAKAVTENQILLRWLDQSGNEHGFTVYELVAGGDTLRLEPDLPADSDSLMLFDRLPLTEYRYWINAFNDSTGSTVGPAIVSTAEAPPDTPSELSAQELDSGMVELSWVDNSSVEDSFRVEISPLGILDFRRIGTTLTDSTRMVVMELARGVDYYFRVRAENRWGVSPWSEYLLFNY